MAQQSRNLAPISKLVEFGGNRAGSIAPLFAIVVIPLVVAMGAVADYTNAYEQQTAVQDAMDAAALAAGKKIGLLTQTQLVSDVNAYYHSNVDNSVAHPPALQVAVNTSTITLTTDLSVPTYFLGIINLHSINFHVTSQATLALGTLEVAMVLDNSGSFTINNNIATEQTAATNLATTLWGLAATSTKPNPVQIALVPFAGEVNVGPQFQTDPTATWLDKTGIGTYNADIMDGTATTVNPFTLLAGMKDSTGKQVTWGGCVEARPIPYDATDDAAVSTSPSTMFVPAFAPDEPDNWTSSGTSNSAGKTSINDSNSTSTVRYNQASTGSQSYNNYLPDVPPPVLSATTTFTVTLANPAVFTIAGGHKLNAGDQVQFVTSGALPTGLSANTTYYVISAGLNQATGKFEVSTSDKGTAVKTTGSQSGTHKLVSSAQWTCSNGSAACNGTSNGVAETGAMSATAKYGTAANQVTMSSITVGGIPGGPNFMCTSTPITALTTSQTTIANAITAMQAIGSTNIEEGLMWGWRVLSPGAPFSQGRAYSVTDNQKIMVFMTDGENTYYPNSKYVGSWYEAWGYISKNHMGTTSTSQSTEEDTMNARTAVACTNIKAAGIKLYVVAFTGDGGISTSGQTTLSNCASDPSMYYVASNASALLSAFSAIGDQITLLRISQ